jgi:hypothetical protein
VLRKNKPNQKQKNKNQNKTKTKTKNKKQKKNKQTKKYVCHVGAKSVFANVCFWHAWNFVLFLLRKNIQVDFKDNIFQLPVRNFHQ